MISRLLQRVSMSSLLRVDPKHLVQSFFVSVVVLGLWTTIQQTSVLRVKAPQPHSATRYYEQLDTGQIHRSRVIASHKKTFTISTPILLSAVNSTSSTIICKLEDGHKSANICKQTGPEDEMPVHTKLGEVEQKEVEDEIFTTDFVDEIRNFVRSVDNLFQMIPNDNVDQYRSTEWIRRLGKQVKSRDYIYYAGGHWKPTSCTPRWKVALVIPFRDRQAHLMILMRNIIPFMMKQQLEFGIFVAEQDNTLPMNRAMISNTGYIEANKLYQWDCVIFHDVDHVPTNSSNYYGCNDFPRHYAAALEEFKYKLAYAQNFGGIAGLTNAQMTLINGYSNMYWGWGGEDDDLWGRVTDRGLTVSRPQRNGYYRSINHKKHSKREDCEERFCLLFAYKNRMNTDGLNSLEYPEPKISLETLYTKISVNIGELEWQSRWGKQCKPWYRQTRHQR